MTQAMPITFKPKAAALEKAADKIIKDANVLNWQQIDPASLPNDLRKAYEGIRAARDAFEEMFIDRADLNDNETLKFGYKYGISVARAPKARASAGKRDYAAFIKSLG